MHFAVLWPEIAYGTRNCRHQSCQAHSQHMWYTGGLNLWPHSCKPLPLGRLPSVFRLQKCRISLTPFTSSIGVVIVTSSGYTLVLPVWLWCTVGGRDISGDTGVGEYSCTVAALRSQYQCKESCVQPHICVVFSAELRSGPFLMAECKSLSVCTILCLSVSVSATPGCCSLMTVTWVSVITGTQISVWVPVFSLLAFLPQKWNWQIRELVLCQNFSHGSHNVLST